MGYEGVWLMCKHWLEKDLIIAIGFEVICIVFVFLFSQVSNQSSAVPGRAGAAVPPDG